MEVRKQIQNIYLYNLDADSWDYTNHFIPGHNWGRSIPINDHMIFVFGGTTSTIHRGQDDHLVRACCIYYQLYMHATININVCVCVCVCVC